ncbi:MAG: glycosyltransferase [Candidatus Omnitrophica bacterium]|nr:glycosyltransferase [Candidatus Omnitrophota bacterium]
MIPQSEIDISVIIPAKDEEKRLPIFLSNLLSHCRASSLTYEIIVVSDGSRDNTGGVVRQFQSKYSQLHLITLKENRGKGFAVKAGFREAKGKVVLFMDADGSTPAEAIEENLHFLSEGYDVVIGSRVLRDSQHSIQAKGYRKFIGKVFNFFVHHLLIKTIKDTQCGFKMFNAKAVHPLFSRLNIDGFGFDLEILYLTNKFGFKVKEVSVNWSHVDESKTNLIVDSYKMFLNIFQIRCWHLVRMNNDIPHMSDDEIAHMFHVEKNHWWFQSKNALVTNLLKKEGAGRMKILDAGCGTGMNLTYLEQFGSCYGCDAVQTALQFCRKNNLKNLVRCHLGQMPFRLNTFDMITVLDVLEHVDFPSKVLIEMKSLLTKDGKMLITVPAFKSLWSSHDEALSHYRRYSRNEFSRLLLDAGLDIEKMGYYFCSPFIFAALIRFFRRILPQSKRIKSDTVKAPPVFINNILNWILGQELKMIDRFPLPFGTTLYAVVKNNPRDANVNLCF